LRTNIYCENACSALEYIEYFEDYYYNLDLVTSKEKESNLAL